MGIKKGLNFQKVVIIEIVSGHNNCYNGDKGR